MEERLVLYQAYEALFRREKLERRWRYRLHYYLLKAHCEELKALGSDGEKYRKEFDKKYIRDQGIGKVEFQLFLFVKENKGFDEMIGNKNERKRIGICYCSCV